MLKKTLLTLMLSAFAIVPFTGNQVSAATSDVKASDDSLAFFFGFGRGWGWNRGWGGWGGYYPYSYGFGGCGGCGGCGCGFGGGCGFSGCCY